MDDPASALKIVEYRDDERFTLGPYPLKTVKASFFRENLFQLTVGFDQNQQEIAEILETRYLLNPDTGKPGTSAGKRDSRPSPYLQKSGHGNGPWNEILFTDYNQEKAFKAYDASHP
jgi:hypothetical protein